MTQTPSPLPAQETTADYWDHVAEDSFNPVWRAHADAVNQALCKRWLPSACGDTLVKTDVFEEAIGQGPLDNLRAQFQQTLYLDLSHEMLVRARRRNPAMLALATDARSLALANESLDCVISFSTLDHFVDASDILKSLDELARCIKPGGHLLITLDNPSNPIVWLRNHLPFALLSRFGLVPYFVGATLSASQLRRELEQRGFHVEAERAALHVPRSPAIAISSLLKHPSRAGAWLRLLWNFEWLSSWPTAYWTGYYVACLARKVKPLHTP